VKELGDEANGFRAKLAVMEIPDNVEWSVVEDCGCSGVERIEEKRRTWG
jgi:hypothetical protein